MPYVMKAQKVKFYLLDEATQIENLIDTIFGPETNKEYNLKINSLQAGTYHLRAEIITEEETVFSPELNFSVK